MKDMSYQQLFKQATYDHSEALYESGYRDGKNDAPYYDYDYNDLDEIIRHKSNDSTYREGYKAGWTDANA